VSLHEPASKFDAKNLHKFLVQVYCECVRGISVLRWLFTLLLSCVVL